MQLRCVLKYGVKNERYMYGCVKRGSGFVNFTVRGGGREVVCVVCLCAARVLVIRVRCRFEPRSGSSFHFHRSGAGRAAEAERGKEVVALVVCVCVVRQNHESLCDMCSRP